MITGVTADGFSYSIEEDALDDQELLDALIDMDTGYLSAYKEAIVRLLGEEQKQALYDFLRDKGTKRVSARAVAEAFKNILEDAGEKSKAVKN